MTGEQNDPLAGFADLGRQMAASLRPFAEMQEKLKTLDLQPPWLAGIQEAARQIIEFNESLKRALAPIGRDLGKLIKNIAMIERQSRLLDQAGFLPHTTTPVRLIEQCGDIPARLSESLENYYRGNWLEIRDKLCARINSYNIDDEAKEAFLEALIAHEHGLYRAVCRHLFPEIERVARIELYSGGLGNLTSGSGKRNSAPRFLQEIAGELYLSEMEPQGYFGLKLFQRLTEHLYVPVQNEDQRKRMEADAVPNRHAAVHGLVVYRSFRNSLNTVFMTDYVLQIIHAVKSRRK